MRIPGAGKLARLAGRCGRCMMSKGLVLMYHRVHDGEGGTDPWQLNVSESHFKEHMQVLRDLQSTVSLADFHSAIRIGKLPEGAIAVTFDDGYADNLLKALPHLSLHEIPATFFITARQSERAREFWWDELEGLVMHATTLPQSLQIVVADQVYRWEIPDHVRHESKDAHGTRIGSISSAQDPVQLTSNPQSRQQLYFQLWGILQSRLQSVQDDVLDTLAGRFGGDTTPRAANRVLTQHELIILGNESLIDIGAHTLTHPQLTDHSTAHQRQELHDSKLWLEEVCGHAVTGLAYPYGSQNHQTRQIVRDLGYEFACTTVDAGSWRFTDSLQIPRMTVLDWDGDEFARQLASRLTRAW